MNNETENEGKSAGAQDAMEPVELNVELDDEELDSVAGGTKCKPSEMTFLVFRFKLVSV